MSHLTVEDQLAFAALQPETAALVRRITKAVCEQVADDLAQASADDELSDLVDVECVFNEVVL